LETYVLAIGLRILCQHNFKPNWQLLKLSSIIWDFPEKKGVVKLHTTRAQLEYHMYANGIEFINLYYVGHESTDINSEQAQQESASILNVLRALMPAEFVESEKCGVYQCFDYSCFDSYNICPLVNC